MSITTNTTTTIKIDGYSFTTKEAFDNYVQLHDLRIEEDTEVLFDRDVSLVRTDIISPENPQLVISTYIDEDDVNYAAAAIQLTSTTRYHRGFGTTIMDALELWINESGWDIYDKNNTDILELDEDFVSEFNTHIKNYNRYGDRSEIKCKMTRDEVVKLLY